MVSWQTNYLMSSWSYALRNSFNSSEFQLNSWIYRKNTAQSNEAMNKRKQVWYFKIW